MDDRKPEGQQREEATTAEDPVGERDLDYGHAFGTQRDRSKGGEPDYSEDYGDDWQEAVPDRDENGKAERD